MKVGDIILSFNYDILMYNALLGLRKMTDSGYKMNFSEISLDGHWSRSEERKSEVTLFKLHGSLNRIRCGYCGALLLYLFQKQTLVGAQNFQCPKCGSGEAFARRMIIPPTQSKEYGDRDIAFLWIQADNLLKEISRIICIGYSFPSSDFNMISLMRRLRARQNGMPEIDFVSPDCLAKKRAERLFGKQAKQFKNLQAYLESA